MMVTKFKFALLLLLLVSPVLSSTRGRAAGTNFLTPAPQKSCGGGLSIVSATYKGKVQGSDQVEVVFDASLDSPCARLGAGDVGDGFGGRIITVKVRRRLGHEDTGVDHSNKGTFPPGRYARLVVVPRGALETDPVSYEVSVKATFGELFHKTVTLTGTGLPRVGAGVGTTSTTSSHDEFRPEECFPGIQVNDLTFNSGAGHVADTVTVKWNATKGAGCTCFPEPKIDIDVQLTRPNGFSTGSIKIQNGTGQTSVNVPVSGSIANGPPTAFTVKVGAENSFFQMTSASKSGNF
jgi:hypothetical protein